MNLERSLIFSYLEEDNVQRAYFRVRPLLTLDGDVQQEAVQLWPNEGGLRIVPDRNEQHTFKIRMRKLGSFCVIDLRNQPAEAGKIRTNKNFKPDRGEVNQYILYSDTVCELPEHTFYQLIEGKAADYQNLAKDVATPLFFIREGDTLYGPVRKELPVVPEPAREAAGMLFDIACPDGVTRSILCMEEKSDVRSDAPAEEDPAQEAAVMSAAAEEKSSGQLQNDDNEAKKDVQSATLPIGKPLQILDQQHSHEETLRQLDKPVSDGANLLQQKAPAATTHFDAKTSGAPLSGTPLVRTPLHVASQQTKNHTQEVVSNQWSIGKYEPPAQNLPNGVPLRTVDNPVQSACSALRAAWHSASSHEQLLDFILSLDGLRPQLETKLCDGQSITAMQRVLRQRLQDLEAERLTALCELDRARRDADAYKQEVITAISKRLQRETGDIEAKKEMAQSQLDAIKAELAAMNLQRDGLEAKIRELQSNALPEAFARIAAEVQMTVPVSGTPLRMSPVPAQHVSVDQLVERLMKVCLDSGVSIDRNTAVAILVLLAISPRIGLSSSTPAALATLLRNIAAAFGWQSGFAYQYAAEQHPMVGMRPIDSTPAILATILPNYAPLAGASKLTVSRNPAVLVKNAAYDVSQWPILMLPALPYIPALEAGPAAPVSEASVAAIAEKECAAASELDAILSPIFDVLQPLSGSARKEMYRFISVCAGLMEGGLPVAADWGVLLWLIPAIERGTRQHQSVKPLLDEFPLSLGKL